MSRTPFYQVIIPEDKEWEIVKELQQSAKLPWTLRQVFVYRNPRQYERKVLEMEHWKVVEVKLKGFHPLLISPRYEETILHRTCYNPLKGRLHVLLEEYESLENLGTQRIFIPPIYGSQY